MRWTPGGLSGDVEDRRSSSGGGGGLGIVGFIILLVISLVTGRNYIGSYLSGNSSQVQSGAQRVASPEEDRSAQLVSFVLDDVQKHLDDFAGATGRRLSPRETRALPRLHLFRMRHSTERHGAVLLSERSKGLHGSGFLG